MDTQYFIDMVMKDSQASDLHKQVVVEMAEYVVPYLQSIHATAEDYKTAARIFNPERILIFKVSYERDDQTVDWVWGYRIQHNSALGPYKGGLRFDASVNIDVLQFLALEQTFKNSLTGLPIGAGKGGSNFNPKDKSDEEIKRFCKSFITELAKHIGPDTDVPAGDIGVGGREIGYMYGQYKKIQNSHKGGVLSGKPVELGGSEGRTEATGYGIVMLASHVMEQAGEELKGKTAVISGAGNVATFTAEKLLEMGAVVLTLSEREGYLKCGEGLDQASLEKIMEAKQNRQSLKEIADELGYTFHEGKPWRDVKADLYLPCATQNELEEEDAKSIVEFGAMAVIEGANLPSTEKAAELLQKSSVLFVPAKAANAGGVAVSTFEMEQNASHAHWKKDYALDQLEGVMKQIFEVMKEHGENEDGTIDYVKGANVGGFVKVYKATKAMGW